MLGQQFYHETMRKIIVAFGTLFNGIFLIRKDNSGTAVQRMKVPLAYGPREKFLVRLRDDADLSKQVAVTLPRLGFELQSLNYDPARKLNKVQKFKKVKSSNKNRLDMQFMPVPYNLDIELYAMAKQSDDALQIVEQILPYFQPSYNVTVELVNTIKEKRDIPIVLENITMQDDYDGDFNTRRVLYYTLRFTAKTYLFGPVSSATADIVKKTSVRYLAGDSKSTTRDITYSVEPRALKDYDDSIVTQLAEDLITVDGKPVPRVLTVDDATNITVSGINNVYIDVDGEEMLVKSKTGNKVTVERGQDGTTIADHVKGAPVKSITTADNAMIVEGDDFGFSGTVI